MGGKNSLNPLCLPRQIRYYSLRLLVREILDRSLLIDIQNYYSVLIFEQ